MELSLSHDERQLLDTILSQNTTVEVIVPRNSDDDVLWHQLTVCLRSMNFFQRAQARVRPIIGRIFRIIKERPELFKNRGYQNFDDFIHRYVYAQLGMSRTVVYECMQIAEKFPSLPMEEYDEVGTTKLRILGQFTNQQSPSHRKHLDRAKEMSVTELRGWAEKRHLIEAGEDKPEVITIPTRKNIADQWSKFSKSDSVHKAAGAIAPGHVLQAMIQECASSWGIEW